MTDQVKDAKVRTAAMLAVLEQQRNAALTDVVHCRAQVALLQEQLAAARKENEALQTRINHLIPAADDASMPAETAPA